MQPLLTNIKEYGIKDISEILPIGTQQVRRYIKSDDLKAVKKRNRYRVEQKELENFMLKKGFTNLNL